MAFLSGLLASIVEWLLSKGFIAAEGAIANWNASKKNTQEATAVQQSAASGDTQNLEKDEQNLLNS